MTNMGKCACDMCTSPLFFIEIEILSFVYETKNMQKC